MFLINNVTISSYLIFKNPYYASVRLLSCMLCYTPTYTHPTHPPPTVLD